jgi:BASS family bile acid:Na+ symporter
MRLTVREIIAPRRRPRLGALASVTNVLLSPVCPYLSARRMSLPIPLEHGDIIGLMIIGSAAQSPTQPKLVKPSQGNLGFSVALTVLPMGATIIHLPLIMPRLISGVDAEPCSAAQPLDMTILAPCFVDLLLKCRYQLLAAMLEWPLDRFLDRVSDRGHWLHGGLYRGVLTGVIG